MWNSWLHRVSLRHNWQSCLTETGSGLNESWISVNSSFHLLSRFCEAAVRWIGNKVLGVCECVCSQWEVWIIPVDMTPITSMRAHRMSAVTCVCAILQSVTQTNLSSPCSDTLHPQSASSAPTYGCAHSSPLQLLSHTFPTRLHRSSWSAQRLCGLTAELCHNPTGPKCAAPARPLL